MSTTRALIQARIQAQITAEAITTLAGALGAASFFGVEAPLPGYAYVARLDRKPKPNQLLGQYVSQEVLESFGIYLVAHNAADQLGTDSSDEIEAMCDELRAVLLGWAPTTGGDVLAYAGGKLVEQKGALLVWAEFYSLMKQIQS
jgi:hypothetical protein